MEGENGGKKGRGCERNELKKSPQSESREKVAEKAWKALGNGPAIASRLLRGPNRKFRASERRRRLIEARNSDDEKERSETINSREMAAEREKCGKNLRRETSGEGRGGEKAKSFAHIQFVLKGFRDGCKMAAAREP